MDKAKENYKKIGKLSKTLGADLFGVADINTIKNNFAISSDLLSGLNIAISIGVRLLDTILGDIKNKPTLLYHHHYRQINFLLDEISLKIASFIQEKGFKALPIPASQIIDWKKQLGHLSHREIARQAGLGWIGRSNLLVTPEFGSCVRLASILTDMKIASDAPITGECGECKICVESCPAGAIKDKMEDFDKKRCFEKIKTFQKEGITNQYICGVCVKACSGFDNG